MSGSVGNPESYWVYRRSPKPKFQIPGLFLVELSLVSACSPMFGWILLRKRRALWRGVRDTGWRRMTGHKAGYSDPRPGAGAVERPSSSFSEPEPGLEPGHGQCCLNTFGDGKKCNIRPQWKDKSTKMVKFVLKNKEYSVNLKIWLSQLTRLSKVEASGGISL